MKLACSTSAFNEPLEQALARVASLGFANVDLIAIGGWPHINPPELADHGDLVAQRVSSSLRASGLTPVAVNMAVGNLHERAPDTCAVRLRQVEAVARLMRYLGVDVASFYPGYRADHRPWEDVLADTVTTIGEILAIGRRHTVTFAVELHFATPFETVEQGERLLEALPELAVAYDPSHYAMQSIPLQETAAFLDCAVHVHLRDAAPGKMQEHLGAGNVDFGWILDSLMGRDYRGAVSVEYLPSDTDDMSRDVAALADVVRRRIGQACAS